MSAPPNRNRRQPPPPPQNERTPSQSNTIGIRVVPYTPPRLDAEGRAPSQASSHSQGPAVGAGDADARRDGHVAELPGDETFRSGRADDHASLRTDKYGSSGGSSDSVSTKRAVAVSGSHTRTREGSALSSSTASSLPLARAKDEGVSGTKLPGVDPAQPTTPALRRPSQVANPTAIHAPFRGSRSPSPTPTSRPTSSSSTRSAAGGSTPRPPRRRNFVAVHSDKTFSLVPLASTPQSQSLTDYHGGGFKSPEPSWASTSRTSSLHELYSSDAHSDAPPSSPLTASTILPDRSHSPLTPSPGSSTTQLVEDPIKHPITAATASPWNYRMVGGLRKVPKTPDLKQKKALYASSPPKESPLPPLPEASPAPLAEPETPSRSHTLAPQPSFSSGESEQSASTSSETTNYKVYGHSSPAERSSDSLVPPLSSHSNYEILGQSSPAAPVNPNYEILGQSSPAAPLNPNYEILGQSSPAAPANPNYEILGQSSPAAPNYEILGQSSPAAPINSSPPETSYSNENYVLHGDPSPSSSLVTVERKPRPAYSQESLVVPPLRPGKRNSYEKFGYYKSRSRESLRGRAGSIKSIKSIRSIHSISSLISQEGAKAFFAASAPVLVNLQTSSSPSPPGRSIDAGAAPQASGASPSPPPGPVTAPRIPMQAHPHQWSSQLSTVMSESDAGSSRALSRSVSPVSAPGNSAGRRSSTGWAGSMHSRQLQSISSSLAAQLEDGSGGFSSHSRSHSRSDSLDRPQPALVRGANGNGNGNGNGGRAAVHDPDEHGDGLADLHQIQQRPSRLGLSGFFSSSNSSERNLHSSASSRTGSFLSSSIPAWARVYYGSGERRFFAPSESNLSLSGDSRPSTAGLRSASGSPLTDHHFPQSIHSARRRAQDGARHPSTHRQQRQPFSDDASMDIHPLPQMEEFRIARGLRRITSSIWSPHLRMDRRASRYSIWEPPSVNWSAESGLLGKRNAQVILFIAGFVFPFAWMIGAVLPLPTRPTLPMVERNNSDSQLNLPEDTRLNFLDEPRYQSTRWWRNLNRCMSVVGLLIIGAIVALVVIGVRNGWTR